uniref:P6 n=1 Tax=Pelargonium radula virus 1 TaxID=2793734 RepID=A0A8D9PH49_9RHAB|nr:TPA_asm: P6 [Pelargonium radula virus 1]
MNMDLVKPDRICFCRACSISLLLLFILLMKWLTRLLLRRWQNRMAKIMTYHYIL